RTHPGLDDKVLVAWNALFTRTLAEAAAAFGRRDWMQAARDNVTLILSTMRRDDGRLLRTWPGGRTTQTLAYAEDYAALLEAVLTLAEVDDPRWLDEGARLAQGLVHHFHDDAHGGFFTTGIDAETLIVRPKDYQDNAVPSENSLASDALLRLAAL